MKIIKLSLEHQITINNNNILIDNKVVDNDYNFIKNICDKKIGNYIKGYSRILSIDITPHCDIKCKYCYYPVDNKKPHKSIDKIINEAIESGYKEISLMGAEPTMHPELPIIIRELVSRGFTVGIITNGNKLFDKRYLEELVLAGLDSLSLSMHLGPSQKVSKKKIQVLKNIKELNVQIIQLTFTISSLDEIRIILPIVDYLNIIKVHPKQLGIRAGAALGACELDSGLFMSDMIKTAINSGARLIKHSGNNLYFCELRYKNQQVHLARWPSNDVALPFSMTGPALSTENGIALSPMAQIMYAKPEMAVIDMPNNLLENKQNVLFQKSV